MTVDGIAASRWLGAHGRLQHLGACLHYVWLAYKAQGASTGRSARTALEAWNRTEGRHPGDRNPPAGVPVWFGAKAGSNAGDVVISLGGGMVVCTDYPSYGRVGTCTISQRQAQIGRPYLGWSEAIFDQRIAFPALSGGGTDSPKPTPVPKEDSTMASVIVGGKHIFNFDIEFISHFGGATGGNQEKITRSVFSATDEQHGLSIADATDLLDGLGIPRWVVDFHNGTVFSPESGKQEVNGTWSRQREELAGQAKILANQAALDKKLDAIGAKLGLPVKAIAPDA